MIYLMTEDTTSALDFWKIVAREKFIKNYEFTIDKVDVGGNTSLLPQLEYISNNIKQNDTVIIIFDNIEENKHFKPADLLKTAKKICEYNNAQLLITNYYCFEEMFLSNPDILNVSSSSFEHRQLLEYVYSSINNNKNYLKQENVLIKEFYNGYINREKFANKLLTEATRKATGKFYIAKHKNMFKQQAVCWIEACDCINKNMNEIMKENICGRCKYSCRQGNRKEKIDNIIKGVIKIMN